MKLSWKWLSAAMFLSVGLIAEPASAAVSYTGATYTQTFDDLANAGSSWANDSTLAGWSLFRRPEPGTAITAITQSNGGSNAGAFYSFGLAGDSERSLGGVGSGGTYWGNPGTGTVAGWMTVALTNDTSGLIETFTVKFDGEQWRQGGNTSPQTMVLEYGFGATFETVAAWTAPGATFDFVSPITTGPGTINGNEDANRVANLGGDVTGVAWLPSDTLWLRWIENNDAGNDHGLGIDNFAFSTGTITPPTDDADFDGDGVISGNDLLIWQRGLGLTDQTDNLNGDANASGIVDETDLGAWRDQFTFDAPAVAAAATVPEPGAFAMGVVAVSAFAIRFGRPLRCG
jgi:hypothetical protein